MDSPDIQNQNQQPQETVMNFHRYISILRPGLTGLLLGVASFLFAQDTNTWIGSGWSLGRAPEITDVIHLDGAQSVDALTWTAAFPHTVAGWVQETTYTNTVTFETTYGDAFPVFTVTGDVELLGGTWTHKANTTTEAWRLKVAVVGDFTLDTAASINVENCGYNSGTGPGAPGVDGGASHAGETPRAQFATYGNILEPDSIGSGASRNRGAGAAWMEVDGILTVDGAISANGSGRRNNYGASPGGSIYIRAGTFLGSGTISANGGSDTWSGSGSGGRIALVSENAVPDTINCSTRGYASSNDNNNFSGAGTVYTGAGTSGTILVDNPGSSANITYLFTHLPAQHTNYQFEDLSATDWILRHSGRVKLQKDTTLASMELEDTNTRLDLNGYNLLLSDALTINGISAATGVHRTATLETSQVFGDGFISVGGFGIVTNSQPTLSGMDVDLNGHVLLVNGATTVKVFYGSTDGGGETNAWDACAVVTDNGSAGFYTHTITPDSTVVCYRYAVENAAGLVLADTTAMLELVALNVEAVSPLTNKDTEAQGQFKIFRPAAVSIPVSVNLAFSGSASNGVDYVLLPETAVIPADSDHVIVDVVPIGRWNPVAQTATLNIIPGNYFIGPADSANVIFEALPPSAGYNTWLGDDVTEPASWSGGIPVESDHILVSGWAIDADMVWGEKVLPRSVASWTQTSAYNGTVQFNTTYGNEFPVFTVNGDVFIDGGTWTHAENDTTPVYYLNLSVAGNFTLDSGAAINLGSKGFRSRSGPGYFGSKSGSAYGGQASRGREGNWNANNPYTYGSILDPHDLGSACNSGTFRGSGAICLDIHGTFTLNGMIVANGVGNYNSGGGTSGGSINVRACQLDCTSTGSMQVNGGLDAWLGSGAGGRIAIRLQQGELPETLSTSIHGQAHDTQQTKSRSGAGTLYIEIPTGKTIIIENSGDSPLTSTSLPALLRTSDNAAIVSDDDIADFKTVNVRLKRDSVVIEHDISVMNFDIEHASSIVDLNGNTLWVKNLTTTVGRVRGGIYSGEALPAGFTDSSVEQTGQLVVGENETLFILH